MCSHRSPRRVCSVSSSSIALRAVYPAPRRVRDEAVQLVQDCQSRRRPETAPAEDRFEGPCEAWDVAHRFRVHARRAPEDWSPCTRATVGRPERACSARSSTRPAHRRSSCPGAIEGPTSAVGPAGYRCSHRRWSTNGSRRAPVEFRGSARESRGSRYALATRLDQNALPTMESPVGARDDVTASDVFYQERRVCFGSQENLEARPSVIRYSSENGMRLVIL